MATSSWTRSLITTAGLLGFAGVATGAAGTHAGGGDLARLASFFLLVHAAVICAIAALGEAGDGRSIYGWAASLLAIGVVMFSGDLAFLAFSGTSPIRWSAPTGGVVMLAGWLLLAVAPWAQGRRRRVASPVK